METGLYYNRFRYYSPETGSYISKDPIGLAGNNPNLYAYVHDSNTQVDPFGLNEIFRGMKESNGKPTVKASARGLGARLGTDIPVDETGMVHPKTGGISMSPSPKDLP